MVNDIRGWITNVALKHLRWATARQNAADKFAHGTNLAGDKHPNTQYSEAVISQLLDRYFTATEQWAVEFKMPAFYVRRVLRGAARNTGESHGRQRSIG